MPPKSRESQNVTPEKFPSVLPPVGYPNASYDFAVQAVMEMQKTVGQLCEAVASLKDQSRDHDRKLEESTRVSDRRFDDVLKEVRSVGMDVHAAKASVKTLLWVMGIVGPLLGIIVGAYLTGKGFGNHPSQVDPRPQSLSAPKTP